MAKRCAPLLVVALAPACAGGGRPSLLPAGTGSHETSPPYRASGYVQSPGGQRYRIALAYDATPTYEATAEDSTCAQAAPPGTADHELRLEVQSLESHGTVRMPDLEIHLSAPPAVALGRVVAMWAGCLIDTSDSGQTLLPHGSVTIRGSISRLPLEAPGSIRLFLSQAGKTASLDTGPEFDENGYPVYADEVVTMRIP
jgi:hypothetical protein